MDDAIKTMSEAEHHLAQLEQKLAAGVPVAELAATVNAIAQLKMMIKLGAIELLEAELRQVEAQIADLAKPADDTNDELAKCKATFEAAHAECREWNQRAYSPVGLTADELDEAASAHRRRLASLVAMTAAETLHTHAAGAHQAAVNKSIELARRLRLARLQPRHVAIPA